TATEAVRGQRATLGGPVAEWVGGRAARRRQAGRFAADEVHVVPRIDRSRRAAHQWFPTRRRRGRAWSHRRLRPDRVQRVIDLVPGRGVLSGHGPGWWSGAVVRDAGAHL